MKNRQKEKRSKTQLVPTLLLTLCIALGTAFASNSPKLCAQQRLPPARTIMEPLPYEPIDIIFGIGLGLNLPFFTPNGLTQFNNLKDQGYNEPLHIGETLRLHFAIAYPTGWADRYALGFATYLMISHRSSSAKGGSIILNSGETVGSQITIGRGYVIFSPALYNQLTFSPAFMVHFAFGPSLVINAVDYKNLVLNGVNDPKARPVPVEIGFGAYLSVGTDLRFGRKFGISIEFSGNIFLSPNRGHAFINGDSQWTNNQVYLGSLGAVVAALFYL